MKLKTFKEFLLESKPDFRKKIKKKKKNKTVAYQHPIEVGGGVTYIGGGEAS